MTCTAKLWQQSRGRPEKQIPEQLLSKKPEVMIQQSGRRIEAGRSSGGRS
jgi:hypothetical protein